ncbi:sugar kinase [Planosporangium flavigriseum]|uniref:PfkB family carbohydrate kinase n=1 Tax=Planosporangium flavigriseum TaxID=373681 RepID=UPI00143BF866|nr:sugar kinase [Planosporangium flavigriseum]
MSVEHAGGSDSRDVFDVVAIGETMAAFVQDGAAADRYRVTAIGAESNVAVGVAQLGCRARWVSRLGEDELGRYVHDSIASHGVDVRVEWDSSRPTGVSVKEVRPGRTRVRYYRSQSAARQLNRAQVASFGTARWLHVTGITPALSSEAADVITMLVERRAGHTGKVSFDVNYRPVLWPDVATASRVLIPLARQADVVFIGYDEAESLLGSCDEAEIARHLLTRDDQELVIKRGEGAASVVTTAGSVSEPAIPTTIVDLTGAGDAFAAGYLTGACWGWDASQRLRLGHFLASRVVGVPRDLGPAVDKAELARISSAIAAPSQLRNDAL